MSREVVMLLSEADRLLADRTRRSRTRLTKSEVRDAWHRWKANLQARLAAQELADPAVACRLLRTPDGVNVGEVMRQRREGYEEVLQLRREGYERGAR